MSSSIASVPAKVPAKRWYYVIPVAAVMYMLAYLDRNNVSVILPFMNGEIQMNASDKGLAAGIFFVGYMFLQIPAAVLAERWSAKKTVLILMIAWSLMAVWCGLVHSRVEFLAARFMLGFFEGGVWPSVLVLLASWFPLKERARANALWMCCLPLSSIIMAPLSGVLLQYMSWRWVFIIEALPPLLWAIVWWFVVADSPKTAKWVSTEERTYVEQTLAADEAAKPVSTRTSSYAGALKDPRALLLIVIYFCWMSGFYGFSLWLPTVLKQLTNGSSALVGWLTAIPYLFALVAMIVVSRWSDRTQNRKLAVAIPLLIGVVAMVAGQFINSPVINIILLCIVAMGVYAPYGPFWAIPAGYLPLHVLAFAMGLINALGNLGGFLGPYAIGALTEATGSDRAGYFLLAGILVLGALLTLAFVKTSPAGSTEVEAPADPHRTNV